jgi:hypothetical protein
MSNVFIGYDSRETVAFTVLSHSILRRSRQPVTIAPIMLSMLGGIYDRPRHALQSTDFSFSRFLTPHLSGYRGWSLFLDCDMLMLADVAELFAMADDRYAVMCVKHDYQPAEEVKFLNQPQTKYAKKNWSSVMLFNNARCRVLDPAYVNTASGLDLHQFKWLDSDALIGSLPVTWNHLVGVYEFRPDVCNVHFTIGGPYFPEYADCDYADLWWEEYRAATFADGGYVTLPARRAAR